MYEQCQIDLKEMRINAAFAQFFGQVETKEKNNVFFLDESIMESNVTNDYYFFCFIKCTCFKKRKNNCIFLTFRLSLVSLFASNYFEIVVLKYIKMGKSYYSISATGYC